MWFCSSYCYMGHREEAARRGARHYMHLTEMPLNSQTEGTLDPPRGNVGISSRGYYRLKYGKCVKWREAG